MQKGWIYNLYPRRILFTQPFPGKSVRLKNNSYSISIGAIKEVNEMDGRIYPANVLILFLLIFTVSACDDNSNSLVSFRDIVEQEFVESDTNQDGVISGSEIDARIARDFDVMDVDMDGVITASDHVGSEYLTELDGEMLEFGPANRGELIDDANADNILTFDEYSNAVQNKFVAVADTNQDGQISLDEALEFHFGPNPGDG